MKRIFATILCFVMIFCCVPYAMAETVIQIGTAAEFDAIRNDLTADYCLTADITLEEDFVPFGEFSGTLDGNGFTVFGLTMSIAPDYSDDNAGMVGLFQKLTGTVKNLRLFDVDIDYTVSTNEEVVVTWNYVGAIAGRNFAGTIENCAVYGDISATISGLSRLEMGGIVGYNSGTVVDCASYVNISASRDAEVWTAVGGLVGHAEDNVITATDSVILDCYSLATVALTNTAASTEGAMVGALVGRQTGATISDAYYLDNNTAAFGAQINDTVTNIVAVSAAEALIVDTFTALDTTDTWRMGAKRLVLSSFECFDLNKDLACDACGDVTACAHVPSEEPVVEIAPTCNTDGVANIVCAICGEVLQTGVILPATGHVASGVWVETIAPTYEAEGQEVQYCTVCGEIAESRPVDKLVQVGPDENALYNMRFNAATLSLMNNLAINFKVPADKIPEGFTNPYAKFIIGDQEYI
ncbi:MAG: hypothetical protein IKY33_04225, partial [Clostridia bacterium]|nr:hypothetical protein [Clostridia bacterium]